MSAWFTHGPGPALPRAICIRWLIRADMAAVLVTERLSFAEPWSEEDFIACLRQRNCIGMVAEREAICGHMVYELRESSIEVLTLAVHPGFRRQGVGSAMIAKLRGKLCGWRRKALGVKVRESDLPAHLFLRSQGFRAVAVLRQWYGGSSVEDAYDFRYEIAPEESR